MPPAILNHINGSNAKKHSNVSFFHVSFMAAASAVMREPVVLDTGSINP
jgi:hypothetical protein